MESDEYKMMATLFPEWTKNRHSGRLYACRCLGHRLRKFGFESHINSLSPRELVVLARFTATSQSKAIIDEAMARATADGDTELLRILA